MILLLTRKGLKIECFWTRIVLFDWKLTKIQVEAELWMWHRGWQGLRSPKNSPSFPVLLSLYPDLPAPRSCFVFSVSTQPCGGLSPSFDPILIPHVPPKSWLNSLWTLIDLDHVQTWIGCLSKAKRSFTNMWQRRQQRSEVHSSWKTALSWCNNHIACR